MASTMSSKVLLVVGVMSGMSTGMHFEAKPTQTKKDDTSAQSFVTEAIKGFKSVKDINCERVTATFAPTEVKTKMYPAEYRAPSEIVHKKKHNKKFPANITKVVVTQLGNAKSNCCVTMYDGKNNRVSSETVSCA